MADTSPSRLVLHTATFLVWLLVAATATYWILKVNALQSPSGMAQATAYKTEVVASASIGRLLGATTAPTASPAAASRFALKGVVSGALGQEAVLIAIDSKPALTFKVGSVVEEGLMVQSATGRQVALAATRDGPVLITLEMPLLDK